MDNVTNYEKFYTFSERYIPPEYEVIAIDVGIENTPSIFTDLRDLVETLPETLSPWLHIYEVRDIEISTMEPTKHGVCIKSKKFTISNIVNLFKQDPEIIKRLPHWLVLERLRSESGAKLTLKEFALNKEEYLGPFRARAVEHLCMKDLTESELIELVSDDSSAVRLAVLESVDAIKCLPDYALRILHHDTHREVAGKAYDLLQERKEKLYD